ncbi:very short patch repair endonuclease [Saccharothrix sp. Mg75]|uniref:very short patch repair endonuclease n=1 Tax=Saccharothrix sp. Mg75 TaxID=3445357 RepID=UPI003EEB114B
MERVVAHECAAVERVTEVEAACRSARCCAGTGCEVRAHPLAELVFGVDAWVDRLPLTPRGGPRGAEAAGGAAPRVSHHGPVPNLETTDDVRARMSKQRSRDTGIEVALRRELHRLGLRYRVHRRPVRAVRREADVVFGPARVAVFVDGCFWHGCPEHGTWPKRNGEFWRAKIEANRARDANTDRRLAEEGWLSVRVWEHEDPVGAADRVRAAVLERRRGRLP